MSIETVSYVVPDDYVEIQDAINSVPTGVFGDIYVRAGLYDLNPDWLPSSSEPLKKIVVKPMLRIHGDGIDRTIIRQYPVKMPYGYTGPRDEVIASEGDTENVTLEDFTVIQNATPDLRGYNGVELRYGSHRDTVIRRVKVTDSWGAGIGVPRFTNLTVEDCVVERVWTGIAPNGGVNGRISGCKVLGTVGDGIYPIGVDGSFITDLVIERNTVEDAGDTAIDITSGPNAPPHQRITARYNKVRNGGIRISNGVDIWFTDNELELGTVAVDAGQGRPINVHVNRNRVYYRDWTGPPFGPKGNGIGFYGALDSEAIGNTVEGGEVGIMAAIWGTGLIEANKILNSAKHGIDWNGWSLGGPIDIRIGGNRIEGFGDAGIYDNHHMRDPGVSIYRNTIFSDKVTARWGVLTDPYYTDEYGKSWYAQWTISENALLVGSKGGDEAISAPSSKLTGNYPYAPPRPITLAATMVGAASIAALAYMLTAR